MTAVIVTQLGLGIDSQQVVPEASNFRPSRWPPPKDFPIVIDGEGNVVSRYDDHTWKLWPWARKSLTLNFGDGPQRKGVLGIIPENANLLRQIAAWWLYGPRAVQTASSLNHRFKLLRPLFILCSRQGICASDITRFPAVADQFYPCLRSSGAAAALSLLHTLYEERELLGFTLLDREGLSRLEAALPDHAPRQTPYIPPRIWLHQNQRLRAFLDEFLEHRERIESCYRFCLDAYARNAGSLTQACTRGIAPSRKPFVATSATGARTGAEFHGHFSQTAKRFGIDGLLQHWLLRPDQSIDDEDSTVSLLSTYFSMVSFVGMAYLLNFSVMRIEEGWSLRANCLLVESDARFGPIYLLSGPTTKTVKDDDARWVTSPSAQVAIDAMTCVARLRVAAAAANPAVPTVPEDISNPYLFLRAYEPWAGTKEIARPLSVRPSCLSYAMLVVKHPRLFDKEELTITDADLQIARLVNPTLDSGIYAVGKCWPLAWHQLRRTGAVNMQASGLVSDASVQYQLKHASRAMSLYYGQGYSKVRLNQKAQNEHIRTMYEVLSKEIARLFTGRFVNPHGDQRKAGILRLIDPKDSKQLVAAAKTGTVSWRETLLGGCTKIGPCEFGGIDNIARCGGGDGSAPCVDALYDREKVPAMRKLQRLIEIRLVEAPMESPYRKSLEAQQRAVENALNVIAN